MCEHKKQKTWKAPIKRRSTKASKNESIALRQLEPINSRSQPPVSRLYMVPMRITTIVIHSMELRELGTMFEAIDLEGRHLTTMGTDMVAIIIRLPTPSSTRVRRQCRTSSHLSQQDLQPATSVRWTLKSSSTRIWRLTWRKTSMWHAFPVISASVSTTNFCTTSTNLESDLHTVPPSLTLRVTKSRPYGT